MPGCFVKSTSCAQLQVLFRHTLPWSHAGFVGKRLLPEWHLPSMQNSLLGFQACILVADYKKKHDAKTLVEPIICELTFSNNYFPILLFQLLNDWVLQFESKN